MPSHPGRSKPELLEARRRAILAANDPKGGGGRSRAPWLLTSLALHAALLAGLATMSLDGSPEEEPEPIPVELLPEPQPEPVRRPLHFRPRATPQASPRVELAPQAIALAPPPDSVRLDPKGSAGGTAVEVSAPSAFAGFTEAGEGGGTAGQGVGAGNAADLAGDSFAAYVGALREVGLDVVFVVDASGTMGWLIEEVKRRLEDLSGAIRRLVPLTRFGVVAYRDRDDPEFVTRVQPLTLSIPKLRRFLGSLRASGGGDLPEAVDAGLRAAVERAGWSAEARAVIVLVGDAPPHPERLEDALAVVRDFRARGGTVTALDVSFDANPRLAADRIGVPVERLETLGRRGVMPEYRRIAEAGGGDAATLAGEVRVVGRLAALVFGERYAAELRPLLGDL